MPARNFRFGLGILLLSGFTTACHDSSGSQASVASSPQPSFADSEPNDEAANAQQIGILRSGSTISVTGTVGFSDNALDDELDTFMLIADGARTIQVVMTHDASVDFDLSFVDPDTGEFLTEESDADTAPEVCTLMVKAGQRVNIEVEAFSGGGRYTLEISSTAP